MRAGPKQRERCIEMPTARTELPSCLTLARPFAPTWMVRLHAVHRLRSVAGTAFALRGAPPPRCPLPCGWRLLGAFAIVAANFNRNRCSISGLLQQMVNTPVLVLNQNYEPLNVCNVRRAFVLLDLGK